MSTWVLVAAAVGFCLIVVLLIGTRRPRNIQTELDRPAKLLVERKAEPPVEKKAEPPVQPNRSGSLAQTSLRTLLVTMHASQATGTLTLTRNDQVCALYLILGHLFHATCDGTEGEQAVQAALSWSDGTYAFDTSATLPTAETVSRPIDQLLESGERISPAVSPSRSAESVDWAGLLNQMKQLADAALGHRSRTVKEILGATPPDRESFIQAIDRIAYTSIMFVDPARLITLAGQMRKTLDDATG